MLKGMGINSIIKLTLAITIASLFIGISTLGALGEAMQHSLGSLGDTTNPEVDIENPNNLASLTEYVRDRAVNKGCEVVDERNEEHGGYTGLQDTHLTQYPECFGGSASLIRGTEAVNPGGLGADDNYMPGVYSTERFSVNQDVTITEEFITNPGSEETRIAVVLDGSPREYSEIEGSEDEINIAPAVTAGSIVIGTAVGPKGTLAGAAVGTILGTAIEGAIEFVDDGTNVAPIIVFFEDLDEIGDRTNSPELGPDDVDLEEEDLDGEFLEIDLCEGDQGYVQSNRGRVDKTSYSDEEPLFPIIVITDTEVDEC